jgi:hypothetical protein
VLVVRVLEGVSILDRTIAVLPSTPVQELEEDAMLKTGQNLPNISTGMTEYLKTSVERPTVGNSTISLAHINASMLITRYPSADLIIKHHEIY